MSPPLAMVQKMSLLELKIVSGIKYDNESFRLSLIASGLTCDSV